MDAAIDVADVALVNAHIAALTEQRDQARRWAVALEQENARLLDERRALVGALRAFQHYERVNAELGGVE